MNFNQNSGLVKLWIRNVSEKQDEYKFSDVPNLYNLREQVKIGLEAIGFIVEEE